MPNGVIVLWLPKSPQLGYAIPVSLVIMFVKCMWCVCDIYCVRGLCVVRVSII